MAVAFVADGMSVPAAIFIMTSGPSPGRSRSDHDSGWCAHRRAGRHNNRGSTHGCGCDHHRDRPWCSYHNHRRGRHVGHTEAHAERDASIGLGSGDCGAQGNRTDSEEDFRVHGFHTEGSDETPGNALHTSPIERSAGPIGLLNGVKLPQSARCLCGRAALASVVAR